MNPPKHIKEGPGEVTEPQPDALAKLAKLAATHEGRNVLIALLSGYELPRPPTGRRLVELLQGLKLPPPIQLAALAASVGPRDKPDEAVRCALRLFIHATAFLEQHRNDTLPDLALAVGDFDLFQAAFATQKTGPLLPLEMDKRSDEARRYLAKRGIKLRKAKSVRENLQDFIRITDMLIFLCLTKTQAPPPQGSLPDKAHQTAVEQQARAAGWAKSESDLLGKFRETRPDQREVYLVPQAILDCLVDFKKGRKHSGGVKSQQTAAANKSSKTS